MGFVGVAPGTTTLTLADGTTIALADWIDDKLDGSAEMQNGDTGQIEIFSNGRSQPIPGGTRAQTRVDTNVPRNGDNGLPKDWEMLIYGIGLEFVRACRPIGGGTAPQLADTNGALSDPLTLRSAFNLDRVIFFAFEYNAKIYSSGVVKDDPTGFGFSTFSTNAAFELVNNGIPSPRDRVAMVLPIHMRENLGFKGILQPEAALVIAQAASDGGTAMAFVDIKCRLFGLIKRTVI